MFADLYLYTAWVFDLPRFQSCVVFGRATVRIALLDMIRKPESRGYHDPTRPLNIVTGMGNNSKDGEAVIKVRVTKKGNVTLREKRRFASLPYRDISLHDRTGSFVRGISGAGVC